MRNNRLGMQDACRRELRRVCGFSEMSHLNHSCPHLLSRTPKLRTDFMREVVVVVVVGGGWKRFAQRSAHA